MELCPSDKCTGCLACYNACPHKAIILNKNDEGFVYPVINNDICVECGLCQTVCPVIDGHEQYLNEPLYVYAAWNKEKAIVRKSSSGGLFSTIAEQVLAKNGVVYGAAFDEKLQVRHTRIDKVSDLEKLRGSKYVQSFMGECYVSVEQDLQHGRRVLFSGTPCQVAGLKSYLGNKDNENLLTIDIVCHGVPSPLMFEEYKSYLERQYNSKMVSYSFRDKKWSWNHFNMKATFENGKEYIGKVEEDFFFRGFLRDFYQRPACHSCLFTSTNRCGDFTLADYWGYKSESGEKKDNDNGVSLVLVNTQMAEAMLRELGDELHIYPRTLEDAMKGNEALYEPFKESPIREEFWKDYRDHGYDYLIPKYFYPERMYKATKRLYKYGRFLSSIISALQKAKQNIVG